MVVQAGEIVGVAGLLGSGRSELLDAIFGADPHASGRVFVDGAPVRPRSTAAAVRAGLALVPEDRMRQGLVPNAELWRNVNLPNLAEMSRARVVPDVSLQLAHAEQVIEQLNISSSGPRADVRQLSGGNAQKVVFGKWLSERMRVFLLDEPTSGIDVGAKSELWRLISDAASHGRAVVLVSSEYEELLALTHRILVMRHGRIVAERDARSTTEHELLMLAAGLQSDEKGPIHHAV
jgi:ribose transport system ATP-binding protein